MNPAITPELREVVEAVHFHPSITIILPFEPKMSLKIELNHEIKLAIQEVEQELKSGYDLDMSALVISRLHRIQKDLNFNTYKKSIAIFVSPVFEKVLYLDIPVEKRVMVDQSFEIRDLVYSKKQLHRFLLLVLSEKESKLFLGDTRDLNRILTNKPETVYAYVNEVPERVSNFSDMNDRQDTVRDKFLHHMDEGLGQILQAYRLPLFVMGAEKILGHFRNISTHTREVIDYIPGNYEHHSIPELKKVLEPHLSDWKQVLAKDLLRQLVEASGKRKLLMGMQEVWKGAMMHRGRLLLVEKDYMFPAEMEPGDREISPAHEPYSQYSYIKDAVDDVIEKVLENGGDVEFVDNGVLEGYDHIALIEFY